jgi:hypothetical protein
MIKQFSVGFSRTVNLGNFESARVEAQITIDVDEDVTFQQQVNAAQTELRLLLEDTWKSQLRKDKKDDRGQGPTNN